MFPKEYQEIMDLEEALSKAEEITNLKCEDTLPTQVHYATLLPTQKDLDPEETTIEELKDV